MQLKCRENFPKILLSVNELIKISINFLNPGRSGLM